MKLSGRVPNGIDEVCIIYCRCGFLELTLNHRMPSLLMDSGSTDSMFSWLCTRWRDVTFLCIKLWNTPFSLFFLLVYIGWVNTYSKCIWSRKKMWLWKTTVKNLLCLTDKIYLQIVHVNEIFYSRVLSVLKILSLDPQMFCPSVTELFLLFWINLCIFVCCSIDDP